MLNSVFRPIATKIPENNRMERIWKLAQTDFRKRYYNDRLGLMWALLNPIIRIGVYAFVFIFILDINRDGIDNYALFLFSGLVWWIAFAEASKKGLNILKSKRYLIENIPLQKTDLFISLVLSVFLGFFFNLAAYMIFAIFFGVKFSALILFVIPLLITLFLLCMGTAVFLSAAQIFLKDMNHLWEMAVLVGFWSSGIFFRGERYLDVFPEFLYINPFLGLIMNIRDVLYFNVMPDLGMLAYDLMFSLVLLFLSLAFFKRVSHLAIERL